MINMTLLTIFFCYSMTVIMALFTIPYIMERGGSFTTAMFLTIVPIINILWTIYAFFKIIITKGPKLIEDIKKLL